MADEFINDVLKKVVAQVCQMIGFERIMTTPLLVLSDILKRFISDLGRKSQQYSEHCGRTTQTVADLDLAFRDFQICPRELCNFLSCVGPLPDSLVVPKFPVEKRHFETPVVQGNPLWFPTNFEDNTVASQINPQQENDYTTEPSTLISKPIEVLKVKVPKEPLSIIIPKESLKIKIPKEPLKIKIPKEPLKIKISLKKINPSSKKKGIEKKKKRAKSKKVK